MLIEKIIDVKQIILMVLRRIFNSNRIKNIDLEHEKFYL